MYFVITLFPSQNARSVFVLAENLSSSHFTMKSRILTVGDGDPSLYLFPWQDYVYRLHYFEKNPRLHDIRKD